MQQRPRRNLRLLLGLGGAAALGLFIAGLALVIFVVEGSSDEHAAATHAAARHPAIQRDVGTTISTSWPCWSSGSKDSTGRHASHRFTVLGPQGEGNVTVELDLLGLGGTELRTYRVRSIEWTFHGKTQKLESTPGST